MTSVRGRRRVERALRIFGINDLRRHTTVSNSYLALCEPLQDLTQCRIVARALTRSESRRIESHIRYSMPVTDLLITFWIEAFLSTVLSSCVHVFRSNCRRNSIALTAKPLQRPPPSLGGDTPYNTTRAWTESTKIRTQSVDSDQTHPSKYSLLRLCKRVACPTTTLIIRPGYG